MSGVVSSERHPSEGEMVRYLDGELSDLEERRLRGHVDRCSVCASHLVDLAADSTALSRYLAKSPDEPPSVIARVRARSALRRARTQSAIANRVGTRLAAVAGICLAVVVSAGPLRAWISDRWDNVRPSTTVSEPLAAAPDKGEREEPTRSVVAFTPRGPRFEMEVENLQAGGNITIKFADVDRATAETTNGTDETMLVLPDGIRVENELDSRASYAVTIPAHVQTVGVTLAGKSIAEIELREASPQPVSYSLSTGQLIQ